MILAQFLRGRCIGERLPMHDMAPMAGRIAHRQEHRPVQRLCVPQGLGAPGEPVNGVVGVLEQIRARLPDETVGWCARLVCHRVMVGVLLACSRCYRPRMAHEGSTGGLRIGALVLAAGAGSRFGGGKLVATLEGRPMLQHVLDTLSSVRPVVTVVVVGPDIDALAPIGWRDEQRVVNPDPGRGLSSSLRLGIEAAVAATDLDGVFILLGDQPRTAVSTLDALSAAARGAAADGALAVVPGYAGGGGANPVLLLRAGFPLTTQLSGDRGLGGLLAARPDHVVTVPVPGSNPDVDTPADLRALDGGGPTT